MKKIILAACVVLLSLGGFWFAWSPLAYVHGDFSFRDLAAIRWAVRTQTMQTILRIYQNTDGTVGVDTGVQRGPLDGGGNHYELKKSKSGWEIEEAGGWAS